MHTWPSGVNYSRILRFSTPNRRFDDELLGNEHTNNVARRMNERQAAINNFQPSVGVLSASIDGPGYLPLYQSGSWEAVYSCGTGPYTFEWSFSSDGINYAYGDNREITSGSLYGCNERLYLRLVVRSADGQAATAFHSVYTVSCGSNPVRVASDEPDITIEPTPIALADAYPNPTDKTARIDFYLPEVQQVRMELLDRNGSVRQVLADGQYAAGRHTREVNGSGLPGGMYFYRLVTNTFSQTKKLIIIP